MATARTALLSIYPRYATKILSGEKRLEFRKTWPSSGISSLVIYATSPVQRIVGIAQIRQVHRASPARLWELAKEKGGGVTRAALRTYFKGKSEGYAIEIDYVEPLSVPIDPDLLFPSFIAPQSFNYLTGSVLAKILDAKKRAPDCSKVIFVAGVHGVGKTSLCQAAAQARGIIHKSASELIREERASAIAVGTKAVRDIEGNQALLAKAIRRAVQAGKPLLIDGHFALLNGQGKPEALSASVFAELAIDAVILVRDRPSRIARRLAQRDHIATSTGEVTALQTPETNQAAKVCKELGLPLRRIQAFDASALGDALGVYLEA